MSNQQQSIGFWQGLGMIWSSLVGASVKSLQAVETTAGATNNIAQSANKSTEVMKANVEVWAEGAMIDVETARVAAQAKRLEVTKTLKVANA